MPFTPSVRARLLEPLVGRDHPGRGLFVTRRKKNGHARPFGERPTEGTAILADRTLQIGHRRPQGGAAPNPLYHTSLPEVVVERDGGGEPLVLLTNDLHPPEPLWAEAGTHPSAIPTAAK